MIRIKRSSRFVQIKIIVLHVQYVCLQCYILQYYYAYSIIQYYTSILYLCWMEYHILHSKVPMDYSYSIIRLITEGK